MIVFFDKQRSNLTIKIKKMFKPLGIIFVILLVLIGIPAISVYASYKKTANEAKVAYDAVKSQDIDKLSSQLPKLKESLEQTKTRLRLFVYLKPIPVLGSYYNDGQRFVNVGINAIDASQVVVEILKPHADELGIRAQSTPTSADAGKRLPVLVKVFETLLPQIEKIAPDLTAMRQDMDKISPNRYFDIGSVKLRSDIKTAKNLINQAENLVTTSRPAIEVFPQIMGADSPKTYLVLFQNDKELRPSGGFLTAYTFLTLDKGELKTSGSDDIYHLDETIDRVCLRKICNLKPPAPIVKYLPEPTGKQKQAIESRDSNISPDWQSASKEFERFYAIAGGRQIDGIIAVDTFLVQDLLEVVGEIKVAGYNQEFNKDNIVQELLGYANVVFAGQPGRKAFLGDVMNSIFTAMLQSPREKLIPLFEVLIGSLNEKHVLLYFHDQKAQNSAEHFSWAGRIKDYDGDYLHINDANFAGGKSNLFVTSEVKQEIDIASDGTVTKTVTINYKNPQKYDTRLNPGLRDWVRLFVPKGSQLVSAEGSQTQVVASEDLGKTVFEGFHIVRPQGASRLIFKYTLPFKVQKGSEYRLLIQKQPGTEGPRHTIDAKGRKVDKPFELTTDKEIKFKV